MGRSMKGKSRRICTKKYSYVDLSWPGLPVVYLPCPHQHLKSPTVDRKSIDRDQHINLLSTPKGYRWDNPQDLNKKQLCPGKQGKKKLLSIEPSDKQQCKSSMDDMWKCMSPDVLEKLISIFVDDFQLPKDEAKEFINEQIDYNKASQRLSMCRCPCAGDSDNQYMWTKEFTDLIGCKLRGQIGVTLCSWRTKRQKTLMELIVNCMSDISGENISFACPETRMQKIMVFAADRMAVWLDRMLDEAERKIIEEDQAAKDSEQTEKRRKEDEARLEAARREDEERKKRQGEEEAARLAVERAAAQAREAAEREVAEREAPEKEIEEPPEAPPAEESTPAAVEVLPQEVPPPVEVPPPPAPEPAEPPPPPVEAEPVQAEPVEAAPPEPAPVEEVPVEEVPVEEVPVEEEPAEEAPVEEVEAEEAKEVPEEEEAVEVEPAEEIVPFDIPFEGLEIEAPTVDPMSVIVDWIKETDVATTDRQKQISKVVKGRLASTLKDYADVEGMGTAIDSLGNQVSTWIDKLASQAEKHMKPLIKAATKFPAPPGVLYHIKRGSDNYYKVRQVSCGELESKKSKVDRPMTSEDVKDFTKWAEGLLHVSDAWTRWVENAFCEAYTMYNRNADKPSELSAKEFDSWREKKRREAMDWKKAQKCIHNRAKKWEEWARFTKNEMVGDLCGGNVGYQDD